MTAANAALIKKKTPPASKVTPTPKPTKPAENVTKLKIYKCGFCSYQSKEIGNVRLHMKIHMRAIKPDTDGDKTAKVSSNPLLAPNTPVSVRRRVFRCQVCSASFDDRSKCLEHIGRDHTAAGRKLADQSKNQAEQPSKSVDVLPDSTSRVNVPSAEQPAIAADATPVDTTAVTAPENNETMSQKDGFEGLNSQEDMDTAEPPSIALYSCDNGTSNFSNDVEFTDDSNVQLEKKDEEMPVVESKGGAEETEPEKTEGTEFTEIPTQSEETQAVNEEETPKDSSIGLDIEAMIAALHSEGPESVTESMPNI